MAAGFFQLLEMLNWKTANPGQDFDDVETQRLDRLQTSPRRELLQSASSTVDGFQSEKDGTGSRQYEGLELRNESRVPVTRAAAHGIDVIDDFVEGNGGGPGNEVRYGNAV